MAEDAGLLHPHTRSRIFEGTVGSTGISIATMARALGYEASASPYRPRSHCAYVRRAAIVMPDDVAAEKAELLVKLGADVEKGALPVLPSPLMLRLGPTVRPVPIVSREHYVHLARDRAEHFGRTELVGPHVQRHHRAGEAAADADGGGGELGAPGDDAPRDDLVVTTSVSDADVYHRGQGQGRAWDRYEERPRGFFADQFEVRGMAAVSPDTLVETMSRTEPGQLRGALQDDGPGDLAPDERPRRRVRGLRRPSSRRRP